MNKESKRQWWQSHRGKQLPRRDKFIRSLQNIGALESRLDYREQLLVKYYFGLNGEFKSLATIGRDFFSPPLTRQHMHHIKESALKKLGLESEEFKHL